MEKKVNKLTPLVSSIVKGLEVLKAEKIVVLDFSSIENLAFNHFIICEGTSTTHLSGMASSVERMVRKELKEKPFSIEGIDNLGWVLIDYLNVVVHVFRKEERQHYNLEGLWGDAIEVKI